MSRDAFDHAILAQNLERMSDFFRNLLIRGWNRQLDLEQDVTVALINLRVGTPFDANHEVHVARSRNAL